MSNEPYYNNLINKTLGGVGGLNAMVTKVKEERALQAQESGLDMDIKRQQLYNLQLTGRKMQEEIVGQVTPTLQLAQAEVNIQMIQDLTKSNAIDSVVGPSPLSRAPSGFWGRVGRFFTGAIGGAGVGAIAGAPFGGIGAIPGAIGGAIIGGTTLATQGVRDTLTGERQNFISGVEQIADQLNLDKLIQSKAQGATFGALSDNELRVLASAATRIGTWRVRDGNGNIIGYNTSEANFRKEMDKINNFARLDYILKGGMPENV